MASNDDMIESPYLKDKESKIVVFKDIPLFKNDEKVMSVPGVMVSVGDVTPADSFGESGEVFIHLPWRRIIYVLWSLVTPRRYLIGLAHLFLLRGKTLKIESKNKCKVYTIPLPDNISPAEKNVLGVEGLNYSLRINFPNASSNVAGHVLTPERFKCILRTVMVPELMKTMRFPAISDSIGYGDIVRSLNSYLEIIKEKKEDTTSKLFHEEEIWNPIMMLGDKISQKLTVSSAVSGCFSSKEIYKEDEQLFPGCVWWTGLHAMMTDVVNKLRSPSVSIDKRSQMENSNFYGDFKRKLASRGITDATSADYYTFLSAMRPIMEKFIRIGQGLSEVEAQVMDSLLTNTPTSTKEVRPAGAIAELTESYKELDAVGGSTAATVEADLLKVLKRGFM